MHLLLIVFYQRQDAYSDNYNQKRKMNLCGHLLFTPPLLCAV